MEDQGTPETTQNAVAESPKKTIHRFKFETTGGDLFMTYLLSTVLTMITFGIYGSWAKVDIRKKLWEGIKFNDESLIYSGTGKELFIATLIFGFSFFAIAMVLGVTAQFVPAIASYVGIFWAILIPVAAPFIIYSRFRYLASRTSLMGVQFGMKPSAREYVGIFLKGMFLTIVSLGFYAAFWHHNIYKFKLENSYYGNLKVIYTGKPKDLFMDYVLAVFLGPLTLGLYNFWFFAKVKNYRLGHTWIGNESLGSVQGAGRLKGGELLVLTLKNVLLVMVTFGIYIPWAMADFYRYFCRNVAFSGNINLNANQENTEARPTGGMADVVATDVLGF
jgi:uncharacterized membrane protein YjgN (DUF898 family)